MGQVTVNKIAVSYLKSMYIGKSFSSILHETLRQFHMHSRELERVW